MKKTFITIIVSCVLLSLIIIPQLVPVTASPGKQEDPHDEIINLSPTGTIDSTIEVVNPYFTIEHYTLADGTGIDRNIINGPSKPPKSNQAEREASITPLPSRGVITNFPSYDWVFGCSAVSAAMIAAYYDNNGFPAMYTGPTNGGVMPLTDTSWSSWSDGYDTYPNNPLIASKNGVDGRSERGSIDNYWVRYGSSANDPYITNGWGQHTWGTSVGDYMKTSQSEYGNIDSSTSFYTYQTSGEKLTCEAMASGGVANIDGTYGMKLFYEARGYTVTECYSQRTDLAGGFSLADFQDEIDAGHPVLINVRGHSMVGYGYDGSTIYIRDTWDSNPNNTYTMTWGGSYEDMDMYAVSVVKIAAVTNQAPTNINLSNNTVAEGRPINTIVGSFSTVDPNPGDTHTYTLVSGTGSADNTSFNINGNQLRTSVEFDKSLKDTYYIRARTSDQGGLFFEKEFTITILDQVTGINIFLPLILHGGGSSPPSGGIVNGDFEQGRVGWTEYSFQGWELITYYGAGFPHSGSWAAWLGGGDDETSRLSQTVTIPASQPYLHFWYLLYSEDFCGYDYARV